MPNQKPSDSFSQLPASDTRAALPPKNLDTPRTFPKYATLDEWKARRAYIRQQILTSCGLYPMPPKTPLNAHVFDRVLRGGYTIEKAYIETYPGFYLAGNLYRPGGASNGAGAKHPAVLVAHGHWPVGRMADTPDGSIPARAITFARQGIVAFTYDMVGYNDTRQITDHRAFAADLRHWLWGVSEMGLQTWNSIRALDFVSELPDVDPHRVAITGESGGGTQTMLLGAIDDRLAAVGPCVMVSHIMQGGCLCENAPGLRVDFSNMEIAACAAPKPQIMVGATGDWTRTMMTIEGPGVASVYKLYGQPDNLKYVIFDYGHNINKTSREAVYAAFGKWLLHAPSTADFHEPPYKMEAVADLRVLPDNTPLPANALTADQLTAHIIDLGQSALESHKPKDTAGLKAFQTIYRPAWLHALAMEIPAVVRSEQQAVAAAGFSTRSVDIGRPGAGDRIPALLIVPERPNGHAVVLAGPAGKSAFMESATRPGEIVRRLVAHGETVLLPDLFLTGVRADAKIEAARHVPFGVFFSTYNRTDLQERVQDLVTAYTWMRAEPGTRRVALAGQGRAGLWALLAAPAADMVAADCDRFDLTSDDGFLTDEMFAPCLRRMGDFRTAAALAAPHPLLLHNTGDHFTASAWLREVYGAIGAGARFHAEPDPISAEGLTDWLTR